MNCDAWKIVVIIQILVYNSPFHTVINIVGVCLQCYDLPLFSPVRIDVSLGIKSTVLNYQTSLFYRLDFIIVNTVMVLT